MLETTFGSRVGAEQKPHLGWRLVCGSRLERVAVGTGPRSRGPRVLGSRGAARALRPSGFLSGLLLGPPESVAKDPGDAVSREPRALFFPRVGHWPNVPSFALVETGRLSLHPLKKKKICSSFVFFLSYTTSSFSSFDNIQDLTGLRYLEMYGIGEEEARKTESRF